MTCFAEVYVDARVYIFCIVYLHYIHPEKVLQQCEGRVVVGQMVKTND